MTQTGRKVKKTMEKQDYFVSYNKNDAVWAKWIAGTLERSGYSVRLQAWDIEPGTNFIERMETFLECSENYLAVYSSSFKRSRYCKQEFYAAFNAYIQRKIKKFLPVRVEKTTLEILYETTVYVDLFDIRDGEQAKQVLLDAVRLTPHPRRAGAYPNARRAPQGSGRAAHTLPRYPGAAVSAAEEPNVVRSIIPLEAEAGKSREMFDRLVQEVLHCLGFGEGERLYRSKAVRMAQHRTEKRYAFVKAAPGKRAVGPEELNAFAGFLDVAQGKYEQEGSACTGYYIARGGFTAAALEQEAERARTRGSRGNAGELILLGPDEVVQELIRAHLLCSPFTAAGAVTAGGESPLYLCAGADLLLCQCGWVWVLYYSRQPQEKASHFAFVHADGHRLAGSVAQELLTAAKAARAPFAGLTCLPAAPDDAPDTEKAKELYFRYLENELGEIQFEGMPTDKEAGAVKVKLESIFVPLTYTVERERRRSAAHGTVYGERVQALLSIQDVLAASPRAAILAKPGGGKSMLIRRMALAYAIPQRRIRVHDGLPEQDWLPVYIRCRDLGENATKSIQEIIGTIVYRAEIRTYAAAFNTLVENRLQDGRILLLIDGLDEIALEKERICFVNQLRTFVSTYPSVHLVLTSRETGFRAVAGTLTSYCMQYTISPLDGDQIRALSLKWHQALLGETRQAKQDADKVCDIILGDFRILTLAENPLLLTTLLFVKRWVGYLPTRKCRLYEEMIKLLLVTWNAAAHDRLDMDETEPQLAFVAFSMTCSGQQKVTKSQLQRYIIAARQAMPDILGYTQVSPAQFIDQVEERSSLLIQLGLEENDDGRLEPSYEFSHLSFQEYLTARAIAQNWNPDPDRYGLLNVVKQHMDEEQWLEVIPLAAVLSGRQAGPAMQYLIAVSKGETDGRGQAKDAARSGDNAALLLGNCIAGEVPLSAPLLRDALLQVVEHKRRLGNRQTHGRRMGSASNLFETILKSKYGKLYRDLVCEEFFGRKDLNGISPFASAWIQICMADGLLAPREIERLLCQDSSRRDKVTGALMMMEWTYLLHSLRGTRGARVHDEAFLKTTFAAVLDMLRSDDKLMWFSAAWCIAWGGYNERNVIPEELYQDMIDRLLALWISTKESKELRRQLSWAIASVVRASVTVKPSEELIAALEETLTQPANGFDNIAAASVLVLTGHWDRKTFQKWRDEVGADYVEFYLRNERYLHDINYLTDDKKADMKASASF